MTVAGTAYELPTSEQRTERFRYFPSYATDTRSVRRGAGWPAGPGEAEGGRSFGDAAQCCLLPTPTPSDDDKGSTVTRRQEGNDRGQMDAVIKGMAYRALLPTLSVADATGGHMNRSGDRSGELLLPGVAKQLGRLLPSPGTPRDCPYCGEVLLVR